MSFQVVVADGVVDGAAHALGSAIGGGTFIDCEVGEVHAQTEAVLLLYSAGPRFEHAMEMIGSTLEAVRKVLGPGGKVVLVSVKGAKTKVGSAGPAEYQGMPVVHLLSTPSMSGTADFSNDENQHDIAQLANVLGVSVSSSFCVIS